VLLVLSPLIAEFLFGATPISNLDALLPVTAIYGGGAVLIRELARRRGPGFGRIALLGAAYAIVEEGLALQSIFNPGAFNAGLLGGRAFGINWVWSEWTIGYHIVWSISIRFCSLSFCFQTAGHSPGLAKSAWQLSASSTQLAIFARRLQQRDRITAESRYAQDETMTKSWIFLRQFIESANGNLLIFRDYICL
jgi:hypothetical protein